jgi:hypothetical protein
MEKFTTPLYDKLNALGYTRFVPQNILKAGILLDITDYVIFY